MGFIPLIFGYDSIISKQNFIGVMQNSKYHWILFDQLIRDKFRESFNDEEFLDIVDE